MDCFEAKSFLALSFALVGCETKTALNFSGLQEEIAKGGAVHIPQGIYRIDSSLVVPSNTTLSTDGPVTIICSGKCPIIDLTDKVNIRINGHLILQGIGERYAGAAPSKIVDIGQVGINIAGCDQVSIDGRLETKNIAGSGIELQKSPSWQSTVFISDVSIHDCYKGIHCWDSGEYAQFLGISIHNCVVGYHVESGNNIFSACKAVHCTTGISLSGGLNNGHGIFSGCTSNHNTYNLRCNGVTLGESFSGCHFIAGQGGADQGRIEIVNSKGITLVGGQVAYSDIFIDDESQLSMRDISLRGPINVTYPKKADFNASGNVVMSGAALAKNGLSWSGNG